MSYTHLTLMSDTHTLISNNVTSDNQHLIYLMSDMLISTDVMSYTHSSATMWQATTSIWFDEWHVNQHWCNELHTLNTDKWHTLVSINVTQTEHKCGNTFINTDNTVSEKGNLLVVTLLIIRDDSVIRYLVIIKFLNFIKGAVDITAVTAETIYINIKHYESRASNT